MQTLTSRFVLAGVLLLRAEAVAQAQPQTPAPPPTAQPPSTVTPTDPADPAPAGAVPPSDDEDDTLTLRGDRQREATEEETTYHRRERRFGSFLRAFSLPFRVDSEKVEATLRNGVLSISLPRAEEDKPRRIAIRAG